MNSSTEGRRPGDRIRVAGTLNLRDLGGHPAAANVVAYGQLFRSETLGMVPTRGWQAIASLGVEEVIDLRLDSERDAAPYQVPAGVRIAVTSVPIGGTAVEAATEPTAILRRNAGFAPAEWDRFFAQMYMEICTTQTAAISRVLQRLCEVDCPPALFHCSGGKDRSGLLAALILTTLGVERDRILDEFELTTRYTFRPRLAALHAYYERLGEATPDFGPLLQASRFALRTLLDALDDGFGSVDGYLDSIGIGGDRRATLQARLIQSQHR